MLLELRSGAVQTLCCVAKLGQGLLTVIRAVSPVVVATGSHDAAIPPSIHLKPCCRLDRVVLRKYSTSPDIYEMFCSISSGGLNVSNLGSARVEFTVVWALLGVLAFGLAACDDQVTPPRDTPGGDDGSTSNVDRVADEVGALHNGGLDSALMVLQAASQDGPLTQQEAKAIVSSAVEQYLADHGFTLPAGAWEEFDAVVQDVQEGYEKFKQGADLVGAYGSSDLSPEAEDIAGELQALASSADSVEQVEAELNSLMNEIDTQLSGEERDAFAGAVGIWQYSDRYWEASRSQWAKTVVASTSASAGSEDSNTDCADDVIASDMSGGLVGLVTGGFTGMAIGGLASSGLTAALDSAC